MRDMEAFLESSQSHVSARCSCTQTVLDLLASIQYDMMQSKVATRRGKQRLGCPRCRTSSRFFGNQLKISATHNDEN
jgi:hypothetical protein